MYSQETSPPLKTHLSRNYKITVVRSRLSTNENQNDVTKSSQNLDLIPFAQPSDTNLSSPQIHRPRQLSTEYNIGRFRITRSINLDNSPYSPTEPSNINIHINLNSKSPETKPAEPKEKSPQISNHSSYDQLMKDLF